MTHDRTTPDRSVPTVWWNWFVALAVLVALVGVPTLVLLQVEFGLLAALGLPRQLTFGVLAMIPGFALGGLSLLVMLGSR